MTWISLFQSLPLSQLFGCFSVLVGIYIYVTKLVDPANEMDAIGSVLLLCSTVMLLTPLLPVVSLFLLSLIIPSIRRSLKEVYRGHLVVGRSVGLLVRSRT